MHSTHLLLITRTQIPFTPTEDPVELAKFLFNGGESCATDVADIIGADSDFARAVGKAYVDLYEITGLSLLESLRVFLKKFLLSGETQAKDRVLQLFSDNYHKKNP
ncbi:hypothetical protein SARC_15714, partial [Sphaeroforma arctica JP610]